MPAGKFFPHREIARAAIRMPLRAIRHFLATSAIPAALLESHGQVSPSTYLGKISAWWALPAGGTQVQEIRHAAGINMHSGLQAAAFRAVPGERRRTNP